MGKLLKTWGLKGGLRVTIFNDHNSTLKKETEIWLQKEGENYFRKLEPTVTRQLLKSQNTIVSLGGGGFINKNIRNQVLKNHLSFWLNWKNSTLINRIMISKKRPIAFNSSVNEIKKMIMDRSKMYSMANFKVNCENLSKNEIVNKIKDIYEKN